MRFLDDRKPVWINDFQTGYVFGTDLQQQDWQYVIVTEGIFDALSIDGLALMHNTVNDAQVRLIRNIGKEIIVVPDQDIAGMELVDRAVELNWAVSIPDWPEGIKDVNDAVIKLGKIATLITILQSKETSRIKIELRKRQLVKRLRN
jgi:DNA primase